MIHVLGVLPAVEPRLEFDEYVPFTWTASAAVIPGPLLWRTGDMQSTLVVIKIHPDSQSLAAATLVSYGDSPVSEPIFPLATIRSEEGIPVVCKKGFPDAPYPRNRIDKIGSVTLAYCGSVLQIGFGDAQSAARAISAGRMHFLLDSQDLLCGIAVSDLGKSEQATITAALSSSSDELRHPSF